MKGGGGGEAGAESGCTLDGFCCACVKHDNPLDSYEAKIVALDKMRCISNDCKYAT